MPVLTVDHYVSYKEPPNAAPAVAPVIKVQVQFEDDPANQHDAPWNPQTDCYNNGICHHHGAGLGMF